MGEAKVLRSGGGERKKKKRCVVLFKWK